jgi:hypothetical protein
MRRLIPLLAALALALPSFAEDADARRHPSFVDGSAFVELASESGELVEVSIGPALLQAVAGAETPAGSGKASALAGLKGIYAYVVSLENDAAREAKALRLISDLETRLDREGWERIVRVRDKGERVNVLTKPGPPGASRVDGLVVLVFDDEDSEVVFANLVGSIDLAQIGAISEAIDVPGLDKAAKEPK